jgi:hypothetical protein
MIARWVIDLSPGGVTIPETFEDGLIIQSILFLFKHPAAISQNRRGRIQGCAGKMSGKIQGIIVCRMMYLKVFGGLF